jgi:gamma-glutamyltranspeptidase/glutathione hydrolase
VSGVVASPQADANAAAEAAFAAGGNAIDAALAAAAVLTVTYPHNCALGGDLFALVHLPGGEVVSVNASGPAGARADAAALRRHGPAMPVTGPATVTVPGLVAGWETLHGLGARLPWADALAAATELARDGAAVAPNLAEAIADTRTGIEADPGMAAVFHPGGTPLRTGDVLRQPALAATLERLATAGASDFYGGDVAARLLAGLDGLGGALTAGDLAGFAPEVGAPLAGAFAGVEVLTSPPNSSGVVLLQALAALDAASLEDPLGADAAGLAEILRAGGEERERLLGDPRAVAQDVEDWLGAERIAALAERARAAARPAARPRLDPRPTGDTAAVVAAGDDGIAVSLIQSLFHGFGAQLLEPSTGVLLHNRGAFFSLRDGHPNALAPGRRPAHTLMPLMIRRGGRLAGVLGTMGGLVHAQIHAQVLLRLLAGATPQEAVDAPRWIVGAMELGEPDDTIRIEDGCDAAARAALAGAGMRLVDVPRDSDWLGHAQAIWLEPRLAAGSDRRADGLRAG